MYEGVYFNDFIKSNLVNDILKELLWMACMVVAGELRELIGSVLLSIAASWEVLVNENIFDVMEFIEKFAGAEGSEDEMEHGDDAGGD